MVPSGRYVTAVRILTKASSTIGDALRQEMVWSSAVVAIGASLIAAGAIFGGIATFLVFAGFCAALFGSVTFALSLADVLAWRSVMRSEPRRRRKEANKTVQHLTEAQLDRVQVVAKPLSGEGRSVNDVAMKLGMSYETVGLIGQRARRLAR